MNRPTPPPEAAGSIAAEAERWLARQDRGLSPAEAAEFARWREASPAAAVEFERLAAAWRTADCAAADPELAALAAQVDADTARARQARRRRTRATWSVAFAAAAALVVAFVIPWHDESPVEPVAIAQAGAPVEFRPSLARTFALPDGSSVLLRGDSEVLPIFTAGERRVRLVRGEAHFTVQKDAARPFVVETEGLAVRAVGTAFNVKRSAETIDVIVTEGTVAFSAPKAAFASTDARAIAGRQARLALGAAVSAETLAIETVSAAEMDRALDWQVGRLAFNRASLADAVAAFNRHAGTRFELADPALATRQISGTFRADRAEAFVRLLE